MLDRYVEDAFSGSDCSRKFSIKTLLENEMRPQDVKEITIDVEAKPSFMVIDDDLR